ncbi:MAG: magnesium transporter [Burkholderiales bacterium]|nr:MAG: magnesium transporter [Burkholderiales bacterium]
MAEDPHAIPSEAATDEVALPRDPEAAQHALAEVQELLRQFTLVRSLAERERYGEDEERHRLAEQVVERQHLTRIAERLATYHPADIAYVLEALPPDERILVWDQVREEVDGLVLVEVSEAVREALVRAMDHHEMVRAAASLDTDELAELAPELPGAVVEEVRRGLSAEERAQLSAALSYPEDSVGARMDYDVVTVPGDGSIETVLRDLRTLDEWPDHTDQIFVVDTSERLVGVVPIARLLINPPEARIEDVMLRDTLTLDALNDASDAAQAFERYDLVSAPVIDASGRLVGRLIVSEVVDYIREESDSDMFSKAGLREEEDLFGSVWESARNRWLWLALNLCTAFFASRVIGLFEGTIERVVALAALMPIVAGIAGNSGNQTMTLFIRSLALGQANEANARRLLVKELGIAAMNGLVWGGVAGLVAWWLYRESAQGPLLGFTMTLAMILNLLLGAIIAMAVPLALQRFGRDPAIGSSVLLTFSTDSMGFFIFLGLATLLFL